MGCAGSKPDALGAALSKAASLSLRRVAKRKPQAPIAKAKAKASADVEGRTAKGSREPSHNSKGRPSSVSPDASSSPSSSSTSGGDPASLQAHSSSSESANPAKPRTRPPKAHPPAKKKGSQSSGGEAASPNRKAGEGRDCPSELRELTLKQIRKATDGFKVELGEGGFGRVYRGKLEVPGEGLADVAVKVMRQDSFQGLKEWETEVRLLGALRHENLVRLYGYCCEGNEFILVYELVPNKSFDYHVFAPSNEDWGPGSPTPPPALPALSFHTRLKVLLGAAQGLRYLHQGSSQTIIFRDFKAANILLDEEFNAKLADFGLAREGPTSGRTHVSTNLVGTSGYMAPEYISTGRASERCDVYSFGVVMMEVLTGCSVKNESMDKFLVDWVLDSTEANKNGWRDVIDPRLKGESSSRAVEILVATARLSVSEDQYARPSMDKIVEALGVAYRIALNDWERRQGKQKQQQEQRGEAAAEQQ